MDTDALDVLRELMSDQRQPGAVRVSAARAVLDAGRRSVDAPPLADLDAALDALRHGFETEALD